MAIRSAVMVIGTRDIPDGLYGLRSEQMNDCVFHKQM